MRIKKLCISGFKSFMDRIEIPFPFGISAVVGPNGCGKSNIVDAIRWAMGEQSAKQLRGRQMEDIIFNGAGQYKPHGMAEVSIILENGDGSFPPEFAGETEISITRRLFRSGESEYLLNSVPCRLKDIHEIFMDTGLGNKAYSIIGQGRIGTIVEQKPEETRIMLEEAAGITKFKKKEAESRRKLELTRKNLQRVEDILVEVQGQMRSLKRQAAKARRFKSIGVEIRRLEMILNSNMFHEYKDESKNRLKSAEDLEQQEAALSAKMAAVQARIEAMNLELDEKDSQILTRRNRYQTVKDEFNRKSSALETIAGEKRMQSELETRLYGEKEDLAKRLINLDLEKTELHKKAERIKQDSERFEDEIALLNGRLKGRKELLSEIREEYEQASAGVNFNASREAGLSQESGYLNKRIEEITDSKARLEKEKDDVNMRMEDLVRASQQKNDVRHALSKKLEDIEKDIADIEQSAGELEQTEKNIEAELKSAEGELNISHTRLSSLKSLAENYEGYKIGVRTIMKAKDLNARNQGRIKGMVADVIQVDPEYEQAVEAVLADKLQYIIVESQEDGKEAVDYLKSRSKGRSSFVSLKDMNSNGSIGKKNGFPLLREIVNVSGPYKHVLDLLLADTAIVQDLGQAISEWRSNGKDSTLVTPEGDMVDSSGIISGGKFDNGSHGILARKREIKELERKVEKYGRDVQNLKFRLEEVGFEIGEKRLCLNKLREEKSDTQEKLNDLDKVIFRLSHEMDQLERLSQRISDELGQKIKEEVKHKDELIRIESELRLCEETKRTKEEYLLKKRLELNESEEEYEVIRNELEKLKMDNSLAQEEKKGILREIERIDEFSEESKTRQEKTEQEIIVLKEKQKEFLDREEKLKEELQGFYEKLRQAEDFVNQAQNERNEFYNEIRELDKNGDALRDESDILKERISRAKLEHSEIRFKMDNLIEQVKERFSMDLTEVYKEYLLEDFSHIETKDAIEYQKMLREKLGEVNLTAIQEHEALKKRFEFIQEQRQDLLNSTDSIMQAIRKINRTCLERFMQTFNEVDEKIKQVFPILFNGGSAALKLTDEKNPLESGVLVEVIPPGKKLSHMGLLSGGEKALVAMALLFAIYLIKPSPFCLLDEVDAPLDEANIDRFNDLLKEIRKYSQVLIVTHNRRSMEIVDSLFGITMEEAGVSKMVAVKLNENKMN